MRPRRGSSLIETVVAMFLISMLVVYILSIFPLLHTGIEKSQMHQSAALIGYDLLQSARAGGFDTIAASSGTQTLTGYDQGNATTQTITYAVTVTSSDTTRKVVTATMTWHETTGDRTLVVETVVVKT